MWMWLIRTKGNFINDQAVLCDTSTQASRFYF